MINLKSIWLTAACWPMGWKNKLGLKKGGKNTSHEREYGRQHGVSSNGSKGRADCWEWWKVPNENISGTLCFFREYRIKSGQRGDLEQPFGKKIASAKGRITSIYTQEWWLSFPSGDTTKRLSIWDFGFILIFSEGLCRYNYGLSEKQML